MPIYEYYCAKCQREFEIMRPMSQANEAACCPLCGGQAQKLVSACASKVDFYIRPPAKPAFRQHTSGSEKK
jgi:putative FmdB family regulatory protein